MTNEETTTEKNNKVDAVNVEPWGDGGHKVKLNNDVEVYVYEDGELDFFDLRKNGKYTNALDSDDERFKESLNFVCSNFECLK